MKPVRGLPTRRSPKNNGNTNPSISSGQTSSGWDRFNNKHTPEQKRTYRDKWTELYPNEPLITPSRFQKTSQETQKEYLRRLWNVVYPDNQIDWENVKSQPIPDIGNMFYFEYACEEKMFFQDNEDEPIDYGVFCPDDCLPVSYQFERIVPCGTLREMFDDVIHEHFMRYHICMDDYYEDETDEWGNKIDNEGNIIEYYDWDIGKRY